MKFNYDIPIIANGRCNSFSSIEKLEMLGALTMSSDSLVLDTMTSFTSGKMAAICEVCLLYNNHPRGFS